MINFIQGTVKENNLDYQVLAVSENFWLSIYTSFNTFVQFTCSSKFIK